MPTTTTTTTTSTPSPTTTTAAPAVDAHAWAVDLIEKYCDVGLSSHGYVDYHYGEPAYIYLTHAPVTAIASIKNNTTGQLLTNGVDYRWQADGLVYFLGNIQQGELKVVYTAGYAVIPAALMSALSKLTAGYLTMQAGGYKGEVLGDYEYTYGNHVGLDAVVDSVKSTLDLWRRRIA